MQKICDEVTRPYEETYIQYIDKFLYKYIYNSRKHVF